MIKREEDQFIQFQNLQDLIDSIPTPSSFSETATTSSSTDSSTETVKEQNPAKPTTSSVAKTTNVRIEFKKTRFGTRNSRLVASVCIVLLLGCIGFMSIIYMFYRKMQPTPTSSSYV
ncbi:unnamed protein product [Ambrosiozyma monospora]|uniref:Unnamed protein product n=1 Tax=Ambrosiozyma monospora TaxID=43982 RepID=A0ACB5SUN9_AMBMO|nr:unnamed protein product [Ambrosiozyma monospora]